MILIFSLDTILLIFAALTFLGVGWATMIASWLWQHAIIVGIVLLILHIAMSLATTVVVAEDYSVVGIVCSVAHAIVVPFILTTFYSAAIESGKSFGFDILANGIIIFGCMSIAEWLWSKAADSSGGKSYLKLIFFTVLCVAFSVFIINMIQREGI